MCIELTVKFQLNVIYDVITGKKTVQAARNFYTNAIKEFVLQKETSPYMKSFQFTVPKEGTGFVDENAVSKRTSRKNYASQDENENGNERKNVIINPYLYRNYATIFVA